MRARARSMVKLACVIALAVGAGALPACTRADETPPTRELVLYSSVDDELLREVVSAYEQETGVRVRTVGDTEATKTTGLVMRLIAEKGAPGADVWWSSEATGTIRLSDEGVLEPYTSQTGEAEFVGQWPPRLRGHHDDWYGFARRARVIAYSPERVDRDRIPRSLADLADPSWKGRVGMARPSFGTTRGHLGALVDAWGRTAFAAWVSAMSDNRLRLYDGNASVVRAIAQGEIDAGLTDTDDVWSGQRNGWAVEAAYEVADPHAGDGRWPSNGPLVVPNTAAVVRGGPSPYEARLFLDFLISARTESRIARSHSGNVPVTPVAIELHPDLVIPNAWLPDLERAASGVAEALSIWDERFSP